MRQKIQNSMILVITLMLLVSYAVATFALYRQTLKVVQDEIAQEADYICAAIEISGDSYLQEMDYVRKSTLITLVAEDGRVLYDSLDKNLQQIDLAAYPDILKALESGRGEDVRRGTGQDSQMFYYSNRLSNGNVLCVHKSVGSAMTMSLEILPVMLGMAAVMIAFAWFLSKWQSRRLIRPINALDLERPLGNEVYEELTPLLTRIDRQNQEKDAIANMRKEFSANVSHELRTPLTSISGYAEIMKEGLVAPDDMKAFSEHIYAEAQLLMALIEDTIRLSRLDEGEIHQEREAVELYALTRAVADRLLAFAKKQEISLTVEGEAVVYRGIRHVLEEMVYNVCENAIKYNKKGGSVRMWVGRQEEASVIRVTDTGIGIAKEEQDRIFERFYRVEKSHGGEPRGTGLGLSIVKHGALVHGARVDVSSELGEGTSVSLVFEA